MEPPGGAAGTQLDELQRLEASDQYVLSFLSLFLNVFIDQGHFSRTVGGCGGVGGGTWNLKEREPAGLKGKHEHNLRPHRKHGADSASLRFDV